MPATHLSLKVTEEYRAKLTALPPPVQREARVLWKDLDWDDLRGSYVPVRERVAISIEYAQREAVYLTAGYMGAFLTSELGKPIDPPNLPLDQYVGLSFSSAPLRDALDTPLIAVLVAIRDEMDDPLGLGLRSLVANIDLDVMRAGRQSLIDAIAADDRCDGFQRAVKGTCPACAAVAGADGKTQFPVHPHCQCVGEPNVIGRLRNRFRRRDAQERFDDLSFEAQNDLYGFDVAQLIRDARLDPKSLARVDGSFMSTKPLKDLRPASTSPLEFSERMGRVGRGVPEEKPLQPSKNFDEVFDEAEQVKEEYRDLLDHGNEFQRRLGADAIVEDDLAKFEEIAARASAADRPKVIIAPLKRRATAEAKLKRKPYGAEGLTDLNRGSILVRNIEDIPNALAQVRRAAKERGWTVHEVWDGFSGQATLGYRDVAVALRSPSGHVTELQFHTNAMWAAKFRGGGHKLYEEMRKFDELGRDLTGLEKAKLRRLRERSVELYNKALEGPPKQVVKVTERPNGAAVSARLDEMSVGEARTYILGPTNRATREVLKGQTETRFMHAVREGNDRHIVWQRNQYLFDQRWDTPIWTKERKKLHEKIIKKFLNGEIREEGIGAPKRVEKPRLISTSGGGASGKSSMIRAGQIDFGSDGAVTVANDLIKEQLPEYVKMLAMKDPWAANAVNEESAYIAKQIAEAAVKNHYNVLLDIVGDGPPGIFAQSIRGFNAAGYSIEVDYASCPLNLALRRASIREAKTGRRADPEAVAFAHRSVAERFDEINAIDSATVRVYDTTVDGPTPLLVYEKLAGHRGRVVDKAGWKRWLAKRTESDVDSPAVLASRRVTLEPKPALEGKDALKYLEEKTPSPRRAGPVEGYQYGRGKELNALLRERTNPLLRPEHEVPLPTGAERASLEELRDKLDAMMAETGTLGRSVEVWRGLPGRPESYGLVEGRTITEKAFSSSSVDKEMAEYFANSFGGEGFTIKMIVNPDVRATYLGKSGMKELLVERDARYVVTHADRHNVTVEVLPPEARDLTLASRDITGSTSSTPLRAGRGVENLVKEAADAIQKVHRIPDDGTVLASRSVLPKDVDARYRVHRDGSPPEVQVSLTAEPVHVVHEFGHHLDHFRTGINGYFATLVKDPALREWRAAIEETDLIKQLRASKLTARNADGSLDELDVGDGALHPQLKATLDYLLDPRELWARSYSQWIGLRSGKFKPHVRIGDVIDQWDEDDFKPIAKALDDYFEKLGLLDHPAPKGVVKPGPPIALDSRRVAVERFNRERPRGVQFLDRDSEVAQNHLADYYKLPDAVRARLDRPTGRGAPNRVNIGDRSLTEFEDLKDHLSPQGPRGWPKGSGWEGVGGFSTNGKAYAVRGSDRAGSTMLHEIGHVVDHELQLLSFEADTAADIYLEESQRWHNKFFNDLAPYYRQGGRGGRSSSAGRDEFMAESIAEVYGDEAAARDRWGDEFVNWIKKQVEAYGRRK